jgi:hypothetical protein
MNIQPIQQNSSTNESFKFVCAKCDYKTNRYYNFKEHNNSIKHIKRELNKHKTEPIIKTKNDTDELQNVNNEILENNNTTNIKQTLYSCDKCNYYTNKKSNYNQHLSSKKHKTEKSSKEYKCECGKIYPYRSSLFNHKKTCKGLVKVEQKQEGGPDPQAPGCAIRGFASYDLKGYAGCPRTGVPQEETNEKVDYKELILTLINQNKELQDLLISQQEEFMKKQQDLLISQQEEYRKEQQEQKKELKNLILHIKPSNNTTNSHNKTINNNNKTFNIMMFLNEKCKDAMTIQDFAERLVVSIEDLEKKKFDCLSNTILKNLKSLAITERPVHCGNRKKKEWYVNDKDNGWELDNGEKLIKNAEYGINKKFQNEFKKHYPNYSTVENIKDKYMQLINRTFTDLPENEKSRLLNMLSTDLLLEE